MDFAEHWKLYLTVGGFAFFGLGALGMGLVLYTITKHMSNIY